MNNYVFVQTWQTQSAIKITIQSKNGIFYKLLFTAASRLRSVTIDIFSPFYSISLQEIELQSSIQNKNRLLKMF